MTIADLKPYTAMKDSGVPWLGEIPEHWVVQRGKNIFRCVDVRSETGKEELLTVSSERGIVPRRSTTVTMFKAESYVGHKLCWPGDLVINSLWAWARGLGVSRYHGIVSTAYGVYRPLAGASVESRFINEFVRSSPFHWELQVRSKGVWTSRLQLTDESFLGAPFPLPPAYEQAAIVRFLDYMDRRIRKYVRAKQKLIKLLEEQKQAIIHRAVTRGLDPNVRLKPSGVEWLGDVPEHWEVMPLRRLTISRCDGPFGSGLKSSHYTDQGIRVIRLQNIGHAEFKDSDAAFISPSHYATLGDHTVESGDLLIAGLGDERHPAGRACVAPAFIAPAMVKADCFRFRVFRQRLDQEFVALHLTGTAVDAQSLLSTGATRQRTNLQTTASRLIAVPPPQEQLAIVQYIMNGISSLSLAISNANREIALLREYCTRLIADVVTGKLDVREAAVRLPDETDEPELIDEADAMSAVDEESVADLDTVQEEAET